MSGSSPTLADSYDIDIEVPAPVTDQATATLLQNLNTSREVEQVVTTHVSCYLLATSQTQYSLHTGLSGDLLQTCGWQ